jgi:hypothetical protein
VRLEVPVIAGARYAAELAQPLDGGVWIALRPGRGHGLDDRVDVGAVAFA